MKFRHLFFLLGQVLLFCFFPLCGSAFDPPVRLIGGADVLEASYGKYVVREYLDLYNDSFFDPVKVYSVTADTWIGHKRQQEGENWLDEEKGFLVATGTVQRIAERQRVVQGRLKPNWWVRWIRFKVQTDKGLFVSNFVASPLKPPGLVSEINTAGELDPWVSPSVRRKPPKNEE